MVPVVPLRVCGSSLRVCSQGRKDLQGRALSTVAAQPHRDTQASTIPWTPPRSSPPVPAAGPGNVAPFRVVLVGAPGSGKGTQAAKIQEDYGTELISTGHLLREAALSGTPLGLKVKDQIEKGGLVDDALMLELIRKLLVGNNNNSHNNPGSKTSSSNEQQTDAVVGSRRIGREGRGWLFDGFPRTLQQARELNKLLEQIRQPLTHVFHIRVDEQQLFDRIKDRLVHEPSGRVYNNTYNPPKVPNKDDITGEELTKRSDDTMEVIRSRMAAFHDSTLPILNYYKDQGNLITVESPTSQIGYVQIKQVLDQDKQKMLDQTTPT